MSAVFGRSWVAMGEPAGPIEASPALLWASRDLVDHAGGRCVCDEVGPDLLPLFLDLGLHPTKLGEAVRVDLPLFTTQGRAKRDLRSAQNRAARAGLRFEVLPPGAVAAVLDELEAVSDARRRSGPGAAASPSATARRSPTSRACASSRRSSTRSRPRPPSSARPGACPARWPTRPH